MQTYGTVRSLGVKDGSSAYAFEFDSREAAEQVSSNASECREDGELMLHFLILGTGQALAAGAPTVGGEQVQLRWDNEPAPDGSAAS